MAGGGPGPDIAGTPATEVTMGLFGSLFGKSKMRQEGEPRCNECGMTGGRHTAWCPATAPQDDEASSAGAATRPPGPRQGDGIG